jgi:putative ABC transport system permease protein
MILNYVKTAVRNLARHRLYAAINILGLSLGIACCILILLFVLQEFSYDTFNSNADSIMRVVTMTRDTDGEQQWNAFEPMPLVPALKAEYPEITRAARFSTGAVILSRGGNAFQETVMFTDPDALFMFDIHLIEGDKATALEDPSQMVLTPEMAHKYFGNEDPLGQQLTLRTPAGSTQMTVSGVAKSMPSYSTLQFGFLANMRTHRMYDRSKDRWTSSNGEAYIMLTAGTTARELESKFPAFVHKYFGAIIKKQQDEGYWSRAGNPFQLTLEPLGDVHLDTKVKYSPSERGNPAYSYILSGIGILVLMIACINFITLAIGRSANRAKEVGVRKVLGAARIQLVRQFWGEAILLSALAMVMGIVLAEALLPTFNELAGRHLELSLINVGFLGTLVLLLLAVGMVAGSYPALVLSRFEPVETLKGKIRLGGRNFFSKGLVVFQFGLSIFLVCTALILSEQIRFMVSSSLGFHSEQVAVLPAHAEKDQVSAIADRFRALAAENPNIESVAVTSGAFTHGYDIEGFKYNGENKTAFTYRIDENYLKTLGIPLVEGRNFVKGSAQDRDHGMIVNEAFVKSMGWSKPVVGKRLIGVDDKLFSQLTVIGVVKDFHFSSFREEIRPAIMFMNPDWPLDDILIRIVPNRIPETVEYIRRAWKEISPNTPFNLTFMSDDFQRLYESEMRWQMIVTSAAVFAIFLACLGLFGLATLAVTNRTKEIGIRKVLGASGLRMVRLVSTDFLKLVALANILAWPLAYVAATKFLENYAYHIRLGPWTFLFAGLGALLIAFATIASQVARAVRANPVEALRYE